MLIRSGALDVVVIDSVAALTPRAEIEGEMGDTHVGPAGPAHVARRCASSPPTSTSPTPSAIFINQLREKIGVMFGSPETTPGGRALKFYSSVRLDIRRIESIKDGVEVVGQPHPGEGRQEQGGPAVPAGRVRHHVRQGHQPRGLAARRRRRPRHREEVGCLVHLRGRAARPGSGERQDSSSIENPEIMVEISERVRTQCGRHRPVDTDESTAGRRGAASPLELTTPITSTD